MTDEKKYLDLIPILQDNHFMPRKIIQVGKKSEKIIGLEVNCPSILKDSRLAAVRAAIGDEFRAEFLSNRDLIEIRLK